MSSKHSHVTPASAPPQTDDLKHIHGIGLATEGHLHDAGILTYAQLAAATPEDLAARLGHHLGLSAEHIAKQNWIGQARQLASTATLAEPQEEAIEPASTRRYATFTVQLLLDDDNYVRRTRVAHIQGGSEETWAGWDETQLVDFFVRHAALRLPAVEPVGSDTVPAGPPQPAAPAAEIGGVPRLTELVAISRDTGERCRLLPHGQPFDVRLALDLGEVIAPYDTPLAYTATIRAKPLGTGEHAPIDEVAGITASGGTVVINAKAAELPAGIYRLEAAVSLAVPTAEAGSQPRISAFLEGSLLHIY
jgi:hypothetical protein